MAYQEPTSFETIYDKFLGKITDDMYVSWEKEDTMRDIKNIFLDAYPGFEFPRFIPDIDEDANTFVSATLTDEEINIYALLMLNTWL